MHSISSMTKADEQLACMISQSEFCMWRHINKAYQELLPQKARTAAGDSINRLERDLFSAGSLEKNVTDVYLALAPEHAQQLQPIWSSHFTVQQQLGRSFRGAGVCAWCNYCCMRHAPAADHVSAVNIN